MSRSRFSFSVAMGIFLVSAVLAAQSPAEIEANKLLSESRWEQAATRFAEIVLLQPKNAAAWIGLGEARLQQKQFAAAETSFSRALELKFRPVANKVNLARVAAAKGDKQQLLTIFRGMIEEGQGYRARAFLPYPEFDRFRTDTEFARMVSEEMVPCRNEPFRQFDFWIGEWEVYDPQEKQKLGHNSVTREQDGCLLVEHWKSGRGIESGSSFNYFDVHDSKWHQMYIDNSGDARAYPPLAGTLVNGKVTLLSDLQNGIQTRWTWYSLGPNKVRQMAEQTADSGKTWSISWDSVYVRQSNSMTMGDH